MKTIHRLLMLSLFAAPVGGCDLLPDKNDGTDDDWTHEAREDEDDRLEGQDDDESEDRDDDDTEVDPVDPVDPADAVRAFAIRHGDLPSIDAGGGMDSGSDGGDGDSGIDPDSLLVIVTNGAATCSDPFAANECGGYWSVSFTLAPELQVPGTYALWEDLNGGFSVTGEFYDDGDCAWGGGSLEGMVEITEIEGATLHAEIFDADAFDFDANVVFATNACE